MSQFKNKNKKNQQLNETKTEADVSTTVLKSCFHICPGFWYSPVKWGKNAINFA